MTARMSPVDVPLPDGASVTHLAIDETSRFMAIGATNGSVILYTCLGVSEQWELGCTVKAHMAPIVRACWSLGRGPQILAIADSERGISTHFVSFTRMDGSMRIQSTPRTARIQPQNLGDTLITDMCFPIEQQLAIATLNGAVWFADVSSSLDIRNNGELSLPMEPGPSRYVTCLAPCFTLNPRSFLIAVGTKGGMCFLYRCVVGGGKDAPFEQVWSYNFGSEVTSASWCHPLGRPFWRLAVLTRDKVSIFTYQREDATKPGERFHPEVHHEEDMGGIHCSWNRFGALLHVMDEEGQTRLLRNTDPLRSQSWVRLTHT